ncbi:MAG: T9SS type A sorting domain-containing protein [Gemmatimonadaceae bacterium]|nr:T9SS type A sorting domain-containing protein [Chitinophagaceae bacterium]
MRRNFYFLSLVLISAFSAGAQETNKVFAITASNTNNADPKSQKWINISEVDLATGKTVKSPLQAGETSLSLYTNGKSSQSPGVNMFAAAAYDRKTNQLFLSPMQSADLRWVDLDDNNTTQRVHRLPLGFVSDKDLVNSANHITRMVIGSNGYGYALNNDATHLIRFSTGRKPEITDLGSLIDDPKNGAVSVHNSCSGWGGDMVADAKGNLYLVTAYQTMFKIDINTKITSYIGTIKGLPVNYTTNGAAVDQNGTLIVSSANSPEGYFSVDMQTWQSKNIPGTQGLQSTSDLASGNLAFEKTTETSRVFNNDPLTRSRVSLYPNPVTDGTFRLSFDKKEIGRYQVQLLDLSGRLSFQKNLNIVSEKQVTEIQLPGKMAKGFYIVKVLDSGQKILFTDKIVVE